MTETILVVGDWSDDGHGKTSNEIYRHNLPSNERLLEAYKAGSLKLNIVRQKAFWEPKHTVRDAVLDDVLDAVADRYEESTIPEDIAQALMANGIEPNGPDYSDDKYTELYTRDGDDYTVEGQEGFANLWMRIAKLGNPNLEYSKVANPNTINIGGYGLFW